MGVETFTLALIKPAWSCLVRDFRFRTFHCALIDSQAIPFTSWKPKIYYRLREIPPRIPVLSQINLLHISRLILKYTRNSILYFSILLHLV
jgi:hypothetical protein